MGNVMLKKIMKQDRDSSATNESQKITFPLMLPTISCVVDNSIQYIVGVVDNFENWLEKSKSRW